MESESGKMLQDDELDMVAGGTGKQRVFVYQVDLDSGDNFKANSSMWIFNDKGVTVDTVKTGDRIYSTNETTVPVKWANKQMRCAHVKKVGGSGRIGWFPLKYCFEKGWQEIEV